MQTVEMPYGSFPVTGVVERYPDGAVRTCTPTAEFAIPTRLGPLVPQFSTDDLRRRTVQAVEFYPDGSPRLLPLERPTRVETPAGPLSVECVTFHPDGGLARAFPLNGKLSGFWSETEEGKLARPATLNTPLGPLTARFISASFSPAGALASLTLWPGESITVDTPAGALAVRIGLSFRPDGTLHTLEPAKPQAVETPIGAVTAFDLDAVGICGDANSLAFAPDGSVERVSTNLTALCAEDSDGRTLVIEPEVRESICGDGEREVTPLSLKFAQTAISVQRKHMGKWQELPLAQWNFRTRPFVAQFAHLAPRSCGG